MERYSNQINKNKREIVLLKGKPCSWGRCTFCDYILDNTDDMNCANIINQEILGKVTGEYSALEVINSGNVFDLSDYTLKMIKKVVNDKKIQTLYFECHWIYRKKLQEIRDYFGIAIIFKLGMETFDEDFRNVILGKGIHYDSITEVKRYYHSVCLMVGIKGQTKEMIERDIAILTENFEYGCVNIYNNNSTDIIADEYLIDWFYHRYGYLDQYPNIDVLYNINDFHVGQKNYE